MNELQKESSGAVDTVNMNKSPTPNDVIAPAQDQTKTENRDDVKTDVKVPKIEMKSGDVIKKSSPFDVESLLDIKSSSTVSSAAVPPAPAVVENSAVSLDEPRSKPVPPPPCKEEKLFNDDFKAGVKDEKPKDVKLLDDKKL